jgi:hypothetical protein
MPVDDLHRLSGVPFVLAEKIINIAGLGRGDRVLCLGETGTAIQTAAAATGARILSIASGVTSGEAGWLREPRSRADAALWGMAEAHLKQRAEILNVLRRHVRSGGRLVAWMVPDHNQTSAQHTNRLQRAIRQAGFTSIITGQLPPQAGGNVVVTGVLNAPFSTDYGK